MRNRLTSKGNRFFNMVSLQLSHLTSQQILYIYGFVTILDYFYNIVIHVHKDNSLSKNTNFDSIIPNQTLISEASAPSYSFQTSINILATSFIDKSLPNFISNFNNSRNFFNSISAIASIFAIYFLTAATKFYQITYASANSVFGNTNLSDQARNGSKGAI